jgi:hypothetical protein
MKVSPCSNSSNIDDFGNGERELSVGSLLNKKYTREDGELTEGKRDEIEARLEHSRRKFMIR